METDVEMQVEKITRKEIVEAMQKVKSGKATGSSEVKCRDDRCKRRNCSSSDDGTVPMCIGW